MCEVVRRLASPAGAAVSFLLALLHFCRMRYLQGMSSEDKKPTEKPEPGKAPAPAVKPEALPKEVGGAKGPEPTRYGDWAHKGRVSDF